MCDAVTDFIGITDSDAEKEAKKERKRLERERKEAERKARLASLDPVAAARGRQDNRSRGRGISSLQIHSGGNSGLNIPS